MTNFKKWLIDRFKIEKVNLTVQESMLIRNAQWRIIRTKSKAVR